MLCEWNDGVTRSQKIRWSIPTRPLVCKIICSTFSVHSPFTVMILTRQSCFGIETSIRMLRRINYCANPLKIMLAVVFSRTQQRHSFDGTRQKIRWTKRWSERNFGKPLIPGEVEGYVKRVQLLGGSGNWRFQKVVDTYEGVSIFFYKWRHSYL